VAHFSVEKPAQFRAKTNSIALWEEKTGILFSGDIVYDGPLVEGNYHSNADDYYASMVRLLKVPVKTVHGGHFPSFDGARYRSMISGWLRTKG
jgi:glyoxylase-like metal-dependent hydrolase (beta-lactamase superfamily II)